MEEQMKALFEEHEKKVAELRNHYKTDFEEYKVYLAYRLKHGPEESLSTMKDYEQFTTMQQKQRHYLSAEHAKLKRTLADATIPDEQKILITEDWQVRLDNEMASISEDLNRDAKEIIQKFAEAAAQNGISWPHGSQNLPNFASPENSTDGDKYSTTVEYPLVGGEVGALSGKLGAKFEVKEKTKNCGYAGVELASAKIGGVASASVGASLTSGFQDDIGRTGFIAETKLVEAEVGPVDAKLGFGLTTAIRNSEGTVGAEVLGTGITVGKEIRISFLGSSIGFKLKD